MESIDNIVEKLYQLTKNNKCVAWVGSGITTDQFPSWKNLVNNNLCSACGVPPLTSIELSGPDWPEKLIEKTQQCKRHSRKKYRQTLEHIFRQQITAGDPRYLSLGQIPFAAYLTTNYDKLLSAHIVDGDIYSYPDLPFSQIFKSIKPIVHLHGTILGIDEDHTGVDSIVLSKTEFKKAYSGSTSIVLKSFLQQVFLYSPVIFFGCSLSEDPLKRILRMVKTFNQVAALRDPKRAIFPKYILLRHQKNADLDAEEDRSFSDLGIDTIRFENYDQIQLILHNLHSRHIKLRDPFKLTPIEGM